MGILVCIQLVASGCLGKPFTKPSSDQNQNINAATTTSEIDTTDWKTYRNEEWGIEFTYPENFSDVKFYFSELNEPNGSLSGGVKYFILRPEIFQEEIFSVTVTKQSSGTIEDDFWSSRQYLSKNSSDVMRERKVIGSQQSTLILYNLRSSKNYFNIIEGKDYNYVIQGWSDEKLINVDNLIQKLFSSFQII